MEDACIDLPSVSLDMRLETVHLTGGQGPPHPPPPLCLRWERSRLLLEVLVGYGQGQLEGGREETEGALQEKKPRGGGEGTEEQHEGRRFKALGGLGGKKAKGGKDSKPKFMIANTDKPSTRRASSLSPRASRSQVWPMGTVLPIVDRVEKHV